MQLEQASTVSLVGLMIDMCRLLHLRDPHKTYHLIDSTDLCFALRNTTLKNSDSVLFQQLKSWIEESPFFQEQRLQCKSKKELLPRKISLTIGSRGGHVLGKAVVGGILSELNFQGEYQKKQAYENYVQVRRRMESRFQKGDQFLPPGRLWLDSSKSDETGFLEQHIKFLEKDSNSLVVSKAIWDIMGESGKVKHSGETFKAFIGDQNRDPFILEGPMASLNIPEGLILDVPEEYKKSFEQDIFGALRDIAEFRHGLRTNT